ncbi:hypothetical protein GCM10009804_06650 [Kribbella hippodromi]|uniref:Uncharacterized protein n=1 Tax=Kribbella hippodromi TaxID=434347 RepID=A0ABN2C4Q4_9ACTN
MAQQDADGRVLPGAGTAKLLRVGLHWHARLLAASRSAQRRDRGRPKHCVNGRIWAASSLHPGDNTVSNAYIPGGDIA